MKLTEINLEPGIVLRRGDSYYSAVVDRYENGLLTLTEEWSNLGDRQTQTLPIGGTPQTLGADDWWINEGWWVDPISAFCKLIDN